MVGFMGVRQQTIVSREREDGGPEVGDVFGVGLWSTVRAQTRWKSGIQYSPPTTRTLTIWRIRYVRVSLGE